MQLKELTLKELLALFDAATHERIRACHADPGIRYIVVFANHFQPDKSLLTVGPNEECKSLDQARKMVIDRKFAKYVVRCEHTSKAVAESAVAPAGLVRALPPPPAPPAGSGTEMLDRIKAELDRREQELLEREDYVTQAEEALILKIQEIERRSTELDQREEHLAARAAK